MTFRATEDGLLFRVEETGTDYRILEGPHLQVGAGQLAGAGALTVRGGLFRPTGAIVFSGAGALVAAPRVFDPAVAALAGSGTLTTRGFTLDFAVAALAGAGSLAVALSVASAKTGIEFDGVGALTVTAKPIVRAVTHLFGEGELRGELPVRVQAKAVLSGAGSLIAAGYAVDYGEVLWPGNGILTTGAKTIDYGVLAWPGEGLLAARVTELAAANNIVLAGSGGLAVAPYRRTPAAAWLAGSGSLDSPASVPFRISLAGTGDLTVGVAALPAARAQLAGAGGLSVRAARLTPANVVFAGTGFFAQFLPGLVPVVASFTGAGLLAGRFMIPAAAGFAGTGNLQANARRLLPVAAGFLGAGQLTAGLAPRPAARAALAGTGALYVAPPPPLPGQGQFAGAGALTVRVVRRQPVGAALAGAGALVLNIGKIQPNVAFQLFGTGALVDQAAHTVYIVAARTNWIRNNTNVGAAAGTPGNNPDFWSNPDAFTGLTRTVSLSMSPEGYPITRFCYQGIVVSGHTNVRVTEDEFYRRTDEAGTGDRVMEGPQGLGALTGSIAFELPNMIPAALGETWAHSMKLALTAGSTMNIYSVQMEMWALGASGNLISAFDQRDVMPLLNGDLQRFSQVSAIPSPGTASIRPVLRFNFYTGSVDFTIDVAGSQLERHHVTDIIKTAGSVVTIGPDLWFLGASDLRVGAIERRRIAAAFAGQGALSVPAILKPVTRASLAGAGQLKVEVRRAPLAYAGLFGTGTLVAKGRYAFPGVAALDGAGALAVNRFTYPRAIRAELFGEGALRSQVFQLVGARLAGAGALAVEAHRAYPTRAALVGQGALAWPAAVAFPTTAHLRGTGLFAGPLAVAYPIAARLAGAGGLAAPVTVARGAAVPFAGAGALHVRTIRRLAAGAWLTGQGDLSARGRVRLPIAAHLVGAGQLTVSGQDTRIWVSAWLRGAGQVAAEGLVAPGAPVRLEGRGALDAALARVSVKNGILWYGRGLLTGAVVYPQFIRARFYGFGRMISRIERVPQAGFGALAGLGQLTVRAREILPTRAAFQGIGVLSTGTVQEAGYLFDGRGELTVTVPGLLQPIAVRLAGEGALGSGGEDPADVLRLAVKLTGQGALVVRPRGDPAISAEIRGAGALAWQPAQINLNTARLHGEGRLTVRAPRFRPIYAEMRGTGRLRADTLVREWVYEPPLILYPPFRVRLLRATTKVA